MKVKVKFTLWISLTAMAAAIFCASFVIKEMNDQFEDSIDYELADIADAVFANLTPAASLGSQPPFIRPLTIRYPLSRFWLRVTNSSGNTIYATKLAELADIPPVKDTHGYMVERKIAREHIWIPPGEREEFDKKTDGSVKLRARLFTRDIGGQRYSVQIAKPMLVISSELNEFLHELALAIVVALLLIVTISYFVAGRILKPLVTINNLIREIRETSLNRRLPLGKSKDELYVLTASLNSMFDRLEHSFQRQRDFIGNASHEMKSPLTILMLGHEDMLSAKPPEDIRNELEKQLVTMQRLNKLIRDLLSIARLEQQETLSREPVDLPELINGVLENFDDILKAKRIKVAMQTPILVFSGDYEKLQRLFINLIDNAIKYNQDMNGRLDIKVIKQKISTLITITNSGATIPDEDIPKIFNQFYRVEKSRAQAYGGTGLGLTIAQRIAEMHGGSIEITSSESITTVLITLPNIGIT